MEPTATPTDVHVVEPRTYRLEQFTRYDTYYMEGDEDEPALGYQAGRPQIIIENAILDNTFVDNADGTSCGDGVDNLGDTIGGTTPTPAGTIVHFDSGIFAGLIQIANEDDYEIVFGFHDALTAAGAKSIVALYDVLYAKLKNRI